MMGAAGARERGSEGNPVPERWRRLSPGQLVESTGFVVEIVRLGARGVGTKKRLPWMGWSSGNSAEIPCAPSLYALSFPLSPASLHASPLFSSPLPVPTFFPAASPAPFALPAPFLVLLPAPLPRRPCFSAPRMGRRGPSSRARPPNRGFPG